MKTQIFILLIIMFAGVPTVWADLIWDSGHREYSEGNETWVYMYNDASVDVTGGWISELRLYNNTLAAVNGGSLGAILSYDQSKLEFTGESNASLIKAFNSSEINIDGGNIHSMETVDNSTANVYSGSFTNIEAENLSLIKLFVEDDYNIDYSGGDFSSGLISGTWLKTGTDFSFSVVDSETLNHIQFVPEPSTLLLLLLGLGGLRKNR